MIRSGAFFRLTYKAGYSIIEVYLCYTSKGIFMAIVKDFVMDVCELYFDGLTSEEIAKKVSAPEEYVLQIIEIYYNDFSECLTLEV